MKGEHLHMGIPRTESALGSGRPEERLAYLLAISVIFFQEQSGAGEVLDKRVIIIQRKEVRCFVAVADFGRIIVLCWLYL